MAAVVEPSSSPRAMVLLRHDLPDGSWHCDWMIENGRGALATFRCRVPFDRAGPGCSFALERIGEHRLHYLGHEGAVSGDRGSVRRLRAGRCVWDAEGRVELAWEGAPPHAALIAPVTPTTWRLQILA